MRNRSKEKIDIPMRRLVLLLTITLFFLPSAYAQRMVDGNGHQIGRAEGLRRMQVIVYFYFFM